MSDRAAATADIELADARAIGEWISGELREYARVFLVDEGIDPGVLRGVVHEADVLLVPASDATVELPGSIVRYRGAAREIGDELYVGDRGVELQDYIAAAYVQILGPTAVTVIDDRCWRAFLDDAELARRTGVFPSALIDPRVILANRRALVRPTTIEVPRVFRIGADGQVSIGMHGQVIGGIDDLPHVVSTPRPRSEALGGVTLARAAEEDPGRPDRIERYLRATDLMKMLRLANGEARIAGFGWTLVEDGLADAEPRPADPFLLECAEGFLLADTGTLRRQLLTSVTAQVVAITQTSSTTHVAAARLARALRVSLEDAGALSAEAVGALGIHPGTGIGAHWTPDTEIGG